MVGYIYLNEYENGYMYVGLHTHSVPIVDKRYSGSSRFARQYHWIPKKINILECCDTIEQLNEAERFWIARYLDLMGVAPCVRRHNPKMAEPYVDGFMLNEQLGGGYQVLSNEAREKIRKANSGEGNAWYGKKKSKEICDKISKTQKERLENPEKHPMYGRTGELNPQYGKKHSDSWKKHQSEALKGKYTGEQSSMYGKHHSEETLAKMRHPHRGYTVTQAVLDARRKQRENKKK